MAYICIVLSRILYLRKNKLFLFFQIEFKFKLKQSVYKVVPIA